MKHVVQFALALALGVSVAGTSSASDVPQSVNQVLQANVGGLVEGYNTVTGARCAYRIPYKEVFYFDFDFEKVGEMNWEVSQNFKKSPARRRLISGSSAIACVVGGDCGNSLRVLYDSDKRITQIKSFRNFKLAGRCVF